MERNGDQRNQLGINTQQFPWFIYVPVVFLLLLKFIYNYLLTVLCILFVYGVFIFANHILKMQTNKSQPPDTAKLHCALINIVIGMILVYNYGNLFRGLICCQIYPSPLHAGDLLWYISMTDIIFKLIILLIKIVVTLLPISILNYSQRSKLYLFIESVCQTYSAILTMPPWMRYWCDTHESGDKGIALLLGTLYLITKTTFILFKLRTLQRSTYDLIHKPSIIGEQPSKGLLGKVENECSICRDAFQKPRILQCKHIFCESCIQIWLNRVRSCPICRSNVPEVDDIVSIDGSTNIWIQLF